MLERLAERPLPDQLTSEINAARREESERLEERVDSFLFDESCDAENDWHSLRLRVATAELASVDAVPDQDNLFPIAGAATASSLCRPTSDVASARRASASCARRSDADTVEKMSTP